jgi:hypothetical protein
MNWPALFATRRRWPWLTIGGVHLSTVLNWRKALGVNRKNNQGTHRLILATIQKTLNARFGKGGSSPFPAKGRSAVWTPEEVTMLGAMPDAEVARLTGRSPAAVMKKRSQLGRDPIMASGIPYSKRYWTVAEDRAVLQLSPQEAARKLGRSLGAVRHRRALLAEGS